MSGRQFLGAMFFGATLLASQAVAATLVEGDGNFSNTWAMATVVASGTTAVSGSGAPQWMGGDRIDVLHFSGLKRGAASVVFDFTLTAPYRSDAYANGGGSIYYSYVPFTGSYYVDQGNGRVLGSHDLLAGEFAVVYNPWDATNPASQGSSSFTLSLRDDFAGELFLAVDTTYGRVSYTIHAPLWASDLGATTSPLPLPAAGWMLLAGLSGLCLVAARRKGG